MAAVTGDVTYTATFKETINVYTVTWMNFDGAVLGTEQYEYGQTAVFKGEMPSFEGATFKGWSPSIMTVRGDMTYTAQFDFTGVYWVEEDGVQVGYYYVNGAVKKGAGLVQVGDYLYWNPLTDKGNALTEAVKELLEDSDDSAVKAQQETTKAIVKKLPYMNISLDGWNGDVLTEKFESPIWEELYKPCLACGTCTFVCPTCQCYDIKDYNTGNGVQRYRCWDSCMYSDFTMMAHGNNRNSQMQRFRQRFMHKLVYFPANNNGMYSCVGCGRCVDKCPSSLNIVKVIKAFAKEGGNK